MVQALAVIILALVYLGYETQWFTVRLASAPADHNIKFFPGDRRITLAAVCFLFIPVFLSPVILKDLFFNMPPPSAEFDCDDSVTLMYRRLAKLGITATPTLGKLSVTGEEYWQSDHVWLMVKIGPWQIPFDWGTPSIGKQYYEGFAITPEVLQEFVEQDYRIRDSMPAGSK